MRREPMSEPLDDVFDSLRPVPPLDGERQAVYRAALLAQARQQRERATPAGRAARLPRRWWSFRFLPQRRWATAGVLVALLLVLCAGTGGAIYAADGAAPGDPLYGLDRAAEAVRLRLTRNPQATAGLLLALASERLEEVQALSDKADSQHLPAALDNYGASISSLARTLGGLDNADPAALSALVDEALTVHEVQLGHLLPTGGAAEPPALTGSAAPKAGQEASPAGAEGDVPPEGNVPPQGDRSPKGSDPAEGDEPAEKDRPAEDCVGADPHPVALSLAETYEVPYEDIMSWFCAGYGFGEIVHALQTSEVSDYSPEELLALKTNMRGWGQVWQELGLIGKGAKAEDTPDDLDRDTTPKEPGGPAPKQDKPEPAGPKPKQDKPDNPGQSKKNKP